MITIIMYQLLFYYNKSEQQSVSVICLQHLLSVSESDFFKTASKFERNASKFDENNFMISEMLF